MPRLLLPRTMILGDVAHKAQLPDEDAVAELARSDDIPVLVRAYNY